jgi:hypothetical protein
MVFLPMTASTTNAVTGLRYADHLREAWSSDGTIVPKPIGARRCIYADRSRASPIPQGLVQRERRPKLVANALGYYNPTSARTSSADIGSSALSTIGVHTLTDAFRP